jgi:peptidoglycan hydrolase-like protein with peptidoglycan-binding domain
VPLYGKNLTVGATGDDVVSLHELLAKLGIKLPENEVHERTFGQGTAKVLGRFQKRQGLEPSGLADDTTVKAIEDALGMPPDERPDHPGEHPEPAKLEYVVRGQVMYRRGLPIAGLPVRAFHRALRHDVPLGAASTDERGEFSISYSPATLPNKAADLQVRAFADKEAAKSGTADDAIALSRVIYRARPLEKVRLRVNGGRETRWSEFQQLTAELSLHLDDASLDSLREQPGQRDLSLLTGKTSQPIKRVADLVVAHKLATATGLPPEAVYGFVRRGAGTDLISLAVQSDAQLASALQRAVDAGIVPGDLAGKIDTIASQLRHSALTMAVQDPSALGGALGVFPEEADRMDFLQRLVTATAVDSATASSAAETGVEAVAADSAKRFWTELAADERYAARVPALQLNLQLAVLTNGHAPLVAGLARRLGSGDGGQHRRVPFRELARYTSADFEAAIDELPSGERVPADFDIPAAHQLAADADLGDEALRVKAYAVTLANIIADAMPTTVFAYRALEDEAQSGDMLQFWRNVAASDSEFELRKGLAEPSALEPLLEGVDDRAAVVGEIGTIKRLFNVTANYDHLTVLRDAGFDSAKAITDLGPDTFIARHAEALGGATQALMYAEKAATISAASLALLTSYGSIFNNIDLNVLPAWKAAGKPNLETLFGSLDLCDCADCRTVLSPAAYLAEVLAWLGKRVLPDGRTARDVLYSRRPDIGEIELSCINTNNRLPYIDLVNELLELVISPISEVTLDATFAAELDGNTLSDGVRGVFEASGTPLSPGHRAYVVTADSHWFLTDRSTLWVVRRESTTELKARFGSYQTSALPDELAAEVEHQRAAAYTLLRDGRFPLTLPLDLWTLEVRTYLGHLTDKPVDGRSATRAEVMRALAQTGTDVDESVDIATEALGLTPAERTSITTASPTDPWKDFGLSEHYNDVAVFDAAAADDTAVQSLDWVDVLHWVRHLLERTGLAYADVVEMLKTDFVNPGAAIAIASADATDPATCAIGKLIVTGWDADAASRLRRFTRLWRRLAWPMRQLDDLITALRGSEPDVNARLDDGFIVALAGVDRLRQRLSIGLDELPGFWAPLRADRADDQYVRLLQNPVVLRPLDEAFAVDTAAPGGAELAIVAADPANALMALHGSTILAALALSAIDLTKLGTLLPDDALRLDNLSVLFRYARLARALDLTVDEMLALAQTADDPFPTGNAGPLGTLRFVDLVDRVRATGLTVAEVDYLLFHQSAQRIASQPAAVTDDLIAVVLDDLRGGLRSIAQQTTPAADPTGEALAKALAGLRWPPDLVTAVVEALQGSTGPATYAATLAALPGGLVVPDALVARTSFVDGSLRIRGALTIADRDALLASSGDGVFQAAVVSIFDAPRALVSTYLKVLEWPALRVPLAAAPAGLTIPTGLRTRVYYDAPAGELVAKTPISGADAGQLTALSTDVAWRDAVAELLAAPAAYIPPLDAVFLSAASASALLDTDQDPVTRFAAVLVPFLAHVRRTMSERLVVQKFSQQFGLSPRVMDRLLTDQLPSASNAAEPAIADFLADPFAMSHPDVPVTRAAFGSQFDSYVRLSKVAHVVSRLRLTTVELAWLDDLGSTVPARAIPWVSGPTAGWWDPKTVPVTPLARSAEPLAGLLRVTELDRLRDGLGETATDALLRAARDSSASRAALLDQFTDAIVAGGYATNVAEVTALADQLGLTAVDDFKDETGATRLRLALRYLRRTGASAGQLIGFRAGQPTDADARAIRQVVKAKYDLGEWRRVAKPLRDVLRAAQRTALVDYILGHPDLFGPEHPVPDEDDLYGYLLIDSQMEPIMMTSRIKQAISSIQLFVQRCHLNLEDEVIVDSATDPGWRDWAWMKNYRVWEANRKVFCYPENWLEPALRDDKTPFFAELESALMQDDVTPDVVEDAFSTYLTRLSDVARLQILGIYDQAPVDGQPRTLHMFGRSHGKTPTYYHRTRINEGAWTAWQRVEVDVSEPQILPIVWNRRLYLFWPVLAEVTPEPVPGDKPTMPTNRRFDLTLAYSRFHRGKWLTTQLTDLTVATGLAPKDTVDRGKSQLVLRAAIPGSGGPDLWIWPEWDDPQASIATVTSPYVPGTPGAGATYATVTGFHFSGADNQVEPFSQNIGGIFEPSGTHPEGMRFVQTGASPLRLPAELTGTSEGIALASAPATFSLAYAHQDLYLSGQRTFVYQDGLKSYVVDPTEGTELDLTWIEPSTFNPSAFEKVRDWYYLSGASAAAMSTALAAVRPLSEPRDGEVHHAEFETNGAAVAEILGADAVSSLGTKDPLRLARAAVDAQRAVLTDAFAIDRDTRLLPLLEDNRFVVSKPDKRLVPISSYVDDARIVGTWNWRWVARAVRRYVFRAGFHPYVAGFQQDLAAGGIARMLNRDNQLRTAAPFAGRYQPQSLVATPYPVEEVDFAAESTYQQYNWELFFHAPLLIATRLSANQRFEDAQRWFHFIFDPTDTSLGPSPARFWQTRPFYEQAQEDVVAQRIEALLTSLATGTADPGMLQQVATWRAKPFNPYAIARLRLPAFQKMVVMRYLDNLIAWGDQLFRQETIESINGAIQLYVLAGQILGRRPSLMAPRAEPQIRTAVSLDPDVDAFSNKLVQIEMVLGAPSPDAAIVPPDAPPLTWPKMLYFGVPRNDRLLAYWETIANRLFKIRNSMTIEGVVRQLPLFEPPIDPALLVRAVAAGVDLTSALSDVSAPAPHYRFRTLAAEALSLAADVRGLGAALLGALEKRDAEGLAILRATNERELAVEVEQVRVRQEAEAKEQIAVLRTLRDGAVQRYVHFQKLLGATSTAVPPEDQPIALAAPSANARITSSDGVQLLDHDKAELDSLSDSADNQLRAAASQGTGSVLSVIPTIAFRATPWGIGTGMSWGGSNLAGAANALASVFNAEASSSSFDASKSSRLAQAIVREHDWVLQSNMAAQEIMHIDRQRLAAEIRSQIATAELANHRTAMDQAQAVQDYLSDKYTNKELYDWMVGQTSAVYFQAYQLAYDVAKRAERAMRRELALPDSDYIQFGYWDSLRKGLLAGDRLQLAIQRMQTAYLDLNRRTYEITKHVSLAALNPAALVDLRETGQCYVQLPEALFDLDRPGDYLRRIKMVSLSLPCVTGPYASVNCRLTLLSNETRVQPGTAGGYRRSGPDDQRFRFSPGGVSSIVTSSGRDDAGLFQPDMNDERFLPFEGEGVISSWRLELPSEFRQFDYDSISDAVLTIRYTALDGGELVRAAALADLEAALHAMEVEQGRTGLYRLFSVRQDFPDAWRVMAQPPAGSVSPHALSVPIGPDRFPFLYQGRALKIDGFALFFKAGAYDDSDPFMVSVQPPTRPPAAVAVAQMGAELGGLPVGVADLGPVGITVAPDTSWSVELTELPSALIDEVEVDGTTVARLKPGAVDDIGILLHYTF